MTWQERPGVSRTINSMGYQESEDSDGFRYLHASAMTEAEAEEWYERLKAWIKRGPPTGPQVWTKSGRSAAVDVFSHDRRVGEHRVPLPLRTVRIAGPNLVLAGVAAFDSELFLGGQLLTDEMTALRFDFR